MNKLTIRIIATVILLSPWIYISTEYKEIMYFILAIVLLLATVDISKKKKGEDVKSKDSDVAKSGVDSTTV